MPYRHRIAAAETHQERVDLKVAALVEALDAAWDKTEELAIERRVNGHNWLIVFDRRPAPVMRDGRVVGIDALVRVFEDDEEVKIDPHRVFINPPIMVHSGQTRLVPKDGGGHDEIPVLAENPRDAFFDVLVNSLENEPNPDGWRTNGTVFTIFGNAADNNMQSGSLTYSTARTNPPAVVGSAPATTLAVGQSFNTGTSQYAFTEMFLMFDTSSLAGLTILSAVLALTLNTNGTLTPTMDVNARLKSWVAPLATTDWVAGGSLSGLTLLAHALSVSTLTSGAVITFTDVALPANINKTGNTTMIITTSREDAGNAPTTGLEGFNIRTADFAGTSSDPVLTVTVPTPSVPFTQLERGIRGLDRGIAQGVN